MATHDILMAADGQITVSRWLWIAIQNAAGRNWARIPCHRAVVLYTLLAWLILAMEHLGGTGAVLAVLSWLVWLAALPGMAQNAAVGAGGGYATTSDVARFLGFTRLFGGGE